MERTEHNATPPPGLESTGMPGPGDLFNFSTIADTIMIPRVILSNPLLSMGERLLWGIIRRMSYPDGVCCAADTELANELAVCDRQLRRYSKALCDHKFLYCRVRQGRAPERILRWHDSFNGKLKLKSLPDSKELMARQMLLSDQENVA